MKDTTEKHVESNVAESAAAPSIDDNPAQISAENVLEPETETKEIPATEMPDVVVELRSEFEQIKRSFAKQNEENADALKMLNENAQNFYKKMEPYLQRLDKNVFVLGKKSSDVENALKGLHGECLEKREQFIKEQSDTIAKQQDSLKELSGAINKLQDCMTRYQNDVLFKAQKEILEDLIQLSDQVRCNILDQEQNQNYESLLDSMKQIGKWIDASLERSKMHKFEDCCHGNTTIDKKRQEVVDIEETESAEKDGYFVTRQPGYLWTIPLVGSVDTMLSGNAPQTFEFVFRPEQVVKLKYKK
ncbi:hypothetical protein FSU_2336 [Fibrobacter succinogenes subsp. succinogenes S85]|uniref:Uncharacterized protein n=1 Tax=Fibrobacter succinogenes (strain ATCC 19169 / S85) TaxID=59374 RepID=C9RS88_FIBSS|nr:co-chaperone GrpE [Fibrobacter succinogenes]ACX75424.1 hypothetical protein Fisuc_1832 [Fibrobacter succinogenes subsp. succinogenes S85]ADL27046.1 hypothetical protein FSU_2336 [Fibrobacter succinogenes subsp. succinogenes S85]